MAMYAANRYAYRHREKLQFSGHARSEDCVNSGWNGLIWLFVSKELTSLVWWGSLTQFSGHGLRIPNPVNDGHLKHLKKEVSNPVLLRGAYSLLHAADSCQIVSPDKTRKAVEELSILTDKYKEMEKELADSETVCFIKKPE
uniref:Uncharacterized protein n=1 Tax=Tanacetum cinerariifolium TaxID=118510 RepID=A0A6L2NQX6_TANCI|nr:hypothetical protein [Tanacetum cinerariifolium]